MTKGTVFGVTSRCDARHFSHREIIQPKGQEL